MAVDNVALMTKNTSKDTISMFMSYFFDVDLLVTVFLPQKLLLE